MNNRTLHIVLSSMLCMAFGACTDDAPMDVPISDLQIQFAANTASSRNFLDEGSLATVGTQITLYGSHDGSSMDLDGKPLTYATVGGEKSWKVMEGSTPQTYYWEESGIYKFYGWLAYDAAGKLTIPDEWSYQGTKLTIPQTIVDKSYNQFDFIYSDVHVRNLDELTSDGERYAIVPLEMKHLFSSISIGAINTTEQDVTIKRVALGGIHECGSATLDYSGNSVSVTYGETSTNRSQEAPFMETVQFEVNVGQYEYLNYSLPKVNGKVGNAFEGTTTKNYYMIWPQDASVVSPTNLVEGETYQSTDSLLVVEYETGGVQYSKRAKFPDMAWEAGKKYHFDIQFADKMVELKATVNPWNYTSADVDFKNEAVEVNQTLAWNDTTSIVDDTKKTVTVKQGQPIVGSFQITAPQGGQWRVSLEGDVQAFTITDDVAPIEDAMGPIDGTLHTIRIVPKISNPDRDYVVRLKFVVLTADGRVLAADDVVQQDGIYQLILPSVK